MSKSKTTKKAAAPKANKSAKAAPNKAAASKTSKGKPAAQPKTKKLSALDAAAKVLGESKEPMAAKEMIEAMAAKGYWKSPGGKTPQATLYAAIIREISTKGKEARFKKTDRGQFTLTK